MDDAFEGGCGDDEHGASCPICQNVELDPNFLAMIEQAAAQPGRAMTADEFMAWLDSV